MKYGEDPTEDMWNDYDHNQNTGELDDLFEKETCIENKSYDNSSINKNKKTQAGTGCLTLPFFFFILWLVL